MHIKLKEYLLLLKEKCEQGNQTPSDFSNLINLIRDLKYDIDDAETTSLLDIVYHVLLEDVELIIENDTWCEQNGDYFAGNMVIFHESLLENIQIFLEAKIFIYQ